MTHLSILMSSFITSDFSYLGHFLRKLPHDKSLRLKFSIPFLFFWIDKVLWLEGRIKFW